MIPHQRFTPLELVDFDAPDLPHVLARTAYPEHRLSPDCWCKPLLEQRAGEASFYYHRVLN